MDSPSTKPTFKAKAAKVLGTVAVLIAVAVGGVIGREGGQEVSKAVDRALTSNTDILVATVKDLNSKITFPSRVDEVTVLTSLTADVQELALIYNMDIEDVDFDNTLLTHDMLKQNIMQMCDPSKSGAVFKEGIYFKWIYRFVSDGRKIVVTLKPEDCIN